MYISESQLSGGNLGLGSTTIRIIQTIGNVRDPNRGFLIEDWIKKACDEFQYLTGILTFVRYDPQSSAANLIQAYKNVQWKHPGDRQIFKDYIGSSIKVSYGNWFSRHYGRDPLWYFTIRRGKYEVV